MSKITVVKIISAARVCLAVVALIVASAAVFACASLPGQTQVADIGMQEAQSRIAKAISEGQKRVDLSSCEIPHSKGYAAFDNVLASDYTYMLKVREAYVCPSGDSEYAGVISLQYYADSQQAELAASASSIVRGIESLSEADKAWAIYERIGAVCEYDNAAHNSVELGKRAAAANPYACLVRGKAICEGYAEAYQLCALMAGLKCEIASWPGLHSWNIVNVDGKWYHLDITWDDNDETGVVGTSYFLRGSETMSQVDYHEATKFAPEEVTISKEDYGA